jgi:hypothetical protein
VKKSLHLIAAAAIAASGSACGGGLQPPDVLETGSHVHGDAGFYPETATPELPPPESAAQDLMHLLLSGPKPHTGFNIQPLGSSPEPVPGFNASPRMDEAPPAEARALESSSVLKP